MRGHEGALLRAGREAVGRKLARNQESLRRSSARRPAAGRRQKAVSGHDPAAYRKAKVLLVDDEEDILATMREVVKVIMPEIDVVTARSGAEALEALVANEGIQAIMTDYQMRGMNGLELAEAVHRQQPGLAVVLVSGFAGQETRDLAKRRGAFSFLAKPFTAADFVEAMNGALGSGKARSHDVRNDDKVAEAEAEERQEEDRNAEDALQDQEEDAQNARQDSQDEKLDRGD
jgi:DNA-binding NtrC family response regulator